MGDAAYDADALTMRGVTFTYAGAATPTLHDVTLTVSAGALALVVGGTGAGKSTLLRVSTPALVPAGHRTGDVLLFGHDVTSYAGVDAADVGLVLQDSEAQVVCEDVRSEMAFGLENLGLPQAEIARRIAETATFLGMTPWFGRRVSQLSGGQRQTLALAATLAMRPRLLLLDEPVAQLDPVAAGSFAALVGRANRELGITVIVATHAPAAFAPYVTCTFMVDEGRVTHAAPHDAENAGAHVLTTGDVRAGDGRARQESVVEGSPDQAVKTTDAVLSCANPAAGVTQRRARSGASAVTMRDLWFRHGRADAWVFAGLDLTLHAGCVHVLLGGNGSGKTTLLRLVAGALRPQRGRLRNACAESVGYLPQGVRSLIGCESVCDELLAWSASAGYGKADALACLCDLGVGTTSELLHRHPYDLSGGQQRLLALAKVLLVRPRLLLLDEPTVGLDATARCAVARAVTAAATDGSAVVMATHDVGLARAVATNVTLLFDGHAAVSEPADEFFAHAWLWGA